MTYNTRIPTAKITKKIHSPPLFGKKSYTYNCLGEQNNTHFYNRNGHVTKNLLQTLEMGLTTI